MTATLFPSLTAPLRSFFGADVSPRTTTDQNDPAHGADMLGTICKLHRSPRFIGEAPMVPFVDQDVTFYAIKQRTFPNSWTAIGSYAATAESQRILSRVRRPRMVVVRYCEKCRNAAERWQKAQENRSS